MKITIEYNDGRRIDAVTNDLPPLEMFKLFHRFLDICEWNGKQLFEMFSYTEKVE
jgi:hypothetical protein